MAAQKAKIAPTETSDRLQSAVGLGGVSPRQLIVEFVLELVESILTAVRLGGPGRRFRPEVGMAGVIGVVAGMATNFSYWKLVRFFPRLHPGQRLHRS